ncbi:uncharacterized protein LOC126661891 [Mercurialis annua]|uniref:uncharacterized protein LOC126661891 n=1 Tax=Mercurialis annua TaxID=3986 RepID=UPI00215FE5AA|nr:uncharacterized protein LOC126661891 [Mercurialis annua]
MNRAWNINLDEECIRKGANSAAQSSAVRPSFKQNSKQDRFKPKEQRPPYDIHQSFNTRGDLKKYFQFHDGHGHVTDECRSLKKETDRLVQVGDLKYFVAQSKSYNPGGNNQGEQSNKRDEGPPLKRQNVAGVINTIAGDMADPEYKRGQRKRKKMVMNIAVTTPLSEVSFGPTNGEGVYFPHQDPLVTLGLIENFWVMKQMVVDEGSLVNLITKEAYLGIGCSVLNLKLVRTPLVGLGGTSDKQRV